MTKEKSENNKSKRCFMFSKRTEPKSRITAAEATAAQKLNIAVRQEGPVPKKSGAVFLPA